jgi:multidrug efflux pump subunit AcrA (membrane-fusion protein)
MVYHPVPEIRVTAAWVMGQDNSSEEFHHALMRLLGDLQPMVRRNAALGLVRFEDARSRPELLKMLRPYTVRSPSTGVVSIRLREEQAVASGTLLAQITQERPRTTDDRPSSVVRRPSSDVEVRSPLPGYIQSIVVRDGMRVMAGDDLVVLEPEAEQVWEALRALYLVGQAEDLPDVERYKSGVPNMPDNIRQQAILTAETIRTRVKKE